MDEQKEEYKTDQSLMDNLREADKLLKRYPSTVIEPPRQTLERNDGFQLDEIKHPAWIKFSTAFKKEMKAIKPNALRIWIYIALSVDYNGIAFPGIKTIATALDISHQTVLTAINELELLGLLTVTRGTKRYNIYHVSDDFIAIGKDKKPVQKLDSSNFNTPMSQNDSPDESSQLDSNKKEQDINKNNNSPKKEKKGDLVDGFLFYQKQRLDQKIDAMEDILDSLEVGLHRNIPRTGAWQDLAKWIMRQGNLEEWMDWYMSDDFRRINSWRITPEQVKNSWPQAPKKYVHPEPLPKPAEPSPVYMTAEELMPTLNKAIGKK